ncbi:aromatic amino acid ammonia-lyase [Leisingera sp. M658]|uniref:aromatic amino acid ammonia-lyase n=1 Tax=Leisingera sp. M658 TaxID=2867015 RepID=UPI0021A6FEE1|nr:aromatic amino acid ammonia-lyase [Leisingera sp. M658]UWQ76366.1 aromatic amino acid lyase [Leisingera sp. M658]
METLKLDGASLTVEDLDRAAHGTWQLDLAPEGLARMSRTHALVARAIAGKIPVYGVTTGLGARATEVLGADALADFSLQTLRGRAHAIGPLAAPEVVRAGLIVRLNTMLGGYSAARPEVARHIATCLNAGLVPVTGSVGSIGAADLVLNAATGLALIGEGEMYASDGSVGPSAELMQAHGITPLKLAPRDGLALANHSCATAARAALTVSKAATAFEAVQTSAAMSMEGFRANTGPLDETIMSIKPHPGHLKAAAGLRNRLAGSALLESGQARRLQDPLSFRNVAQIHGTAKTALDRAMGCVQIEISSASDNPIALAEREKLVSCGAYFTSEITSAAETLSRSFVPLAMAQLARAAKLLNPEFSGLPSFLAMPDSASNGFAPVMKVAESLVAEIAHAAQSVPVWPSVNANGVEDCLTGSPAAVSALDRIADNVFHLTSIELLIACQAIELRKGSGNCGRFLAGMNNQVRKISPVLREDRPLAKDIEHLSATLKEKLIAFCPPDASG